MEQSRLDHNEYEPLRREYSRLAAQYDLDIRCGTGALLEALWSCPALVDGFGLSDPYSRVRPHSPEKAIHWKPQEGRSQSGQMHSIPSNQPSSGHRPQLGID